MDYFYTKSEYRLINDWMNIRRCNPLINQRNTVKLALLEEGRY
jgi:hypothetical protein